MSATKFDISYSAAAQLGSLASAEKSALQRLFASGEIEDPVTTRPTDDGRFVSRLGSKLVLWRRLSADG
ncbi:hypothetical protein DK419_26970 [Methylobacterium terrae]|uniref:Uncharacterized protein n=1 Tax=Methylobacterium terrae TaxID=2202827 RepID=A0A2U8WVU4_9HYPH|nr:hypothetical protein [Methylobacterium terrae]AWN49531.1 hypothetical protein DK419_26970 [Methylobacterium terrae]